MKKIFLIFSICFFAELSYSQNINLTLQSQLDFTNAYSSLFGYVDDFGNEYALLGTWQGVSVINVTDPANPVIVANVPSAQPASGAIVWREIKTFDHHAYVTNEQDSALLIIDLTNLPNNNISYHHFFSNNLRKAHTCWVDENGILYLFGFNTYSGLAQAQRGAMMFDLNIDPDNPQYIAQYNGAYIHDGIVRGDTLWASEVYQGKLVILDVTDKTNFQVLGQVTTPLAFTHNSWPTSDNHYSFTTDELSNSSLTSYDVSDLGNITKLDEAQSNPGSNSVIHNVHLYNNDFAVASYYRDGVTIFDVSDPTNMIKVGSYDTSPLSGFGYDGDWGVYPYLPSKNIIVSDMQGGLFVFGVNYQKACRIKGVVTDTFTNALLNGVQVELLQPSIIDSTNYLGIYNTGVLNEGLFDIQFSKPGYFTKTIFNVQLDSAQTVMLDVQLVPDVPFDISMTVVDSATGQPIPNANVFITDNVQYNFSFIADASGIVSITQIYTANYSIYAGEWSHVTRQIVSQQLNPTTTGLTIELPKGYYDDFFFNFGWTASGNASTGEWVRGVPVLTTNGNSECNPGIDVLNDYGSECFITGNGGGAASDDDVDGGAAIFTSPVFDLQSSFDPRINYYSWFYNGGGTSAINDSLKIFISNGDSTKLVEFTFSDTTQMSQWLFHDFRIKDFVEPSSNMQLIVRTADLNTSGHLLEGGIDLFKVIDTAKFNSVSYLDETNFGVKLYPNPTNGIFIIQSILLNSDAKVEITELTGRIILSDKIHNQLNELTIDASGFSKGIYLIRIFSNDHISTEKLIIQ